jgi:hypothetical protein
VLTFAFSESRDEDVVRLRRLDLDPLVALTKDNTLVAEVI